MTSRVFCKDCRHRSKEWHALPSGRVLSLPGDECTATAARIVRTDPIDGDRTSRVKCRAKNRHFDCKDFEAKPPAAPSPPFWLLPAIIVLVAAVLIVLAFVFAGGAVR